MIAVAYDPRKAMEVTLEAALRDRPFVADWSPRSDAIVGISQVQSL